MERLDDILLERLTIRGRTQYPTQIYQRFDLYIRYRSSDESWRNKQTFTIVRLV
jgi:hypothetical protein